jgi:TPR repeat protein
LTSLLCLTLANPVWSAEPDPFDLALTHYVQGDFVLAAQEFGVLAQKGHPGALHNLAAMHLRGELPDASPFKAKELLERSAAGGFVTAMVALGQLYEGDLLGPPDLKRSLAWYTEAAERGSADAQVVVATAYYLGRGIAQDAGEAARWYREAAVQGDPGAMYILAAQYEKGDGVGQDLRLARYWYSAAAGAGDDAAPYKVKELDSRLAQASAPAQ